MAIRKVRILMNGVTGRMGRTQHLERSILAIVRQGGIRASDDLTIVPEPILAGRNAARLEALARSIGGPSLPCTTDVDGALADPSVEVFFDASDTRSRGGFVERAVAAGKAVYCEKPTATSSAEARRLAELAERAGVKNGVVADKLWLPGIRKLRMLRDQGFFGRILSVRGEFGYWVFTGHVPDQPAQRPSWNYRRDQGGGIVSDMLCHWRYLLDDLFGGVLGVSCTATTHVGERVGEDGAPYAANADDACYATFALPGGVVAQWNSSWCVRVRRDDLLTIQVDGTSGSGVAGLRRCWAQAHAQTPRATWNPDIDDPFDHRAAWLEVPGTVAYDNVFKCQWEAFLRHVVLGAPFPWTLREAAKGVELAELALRSSAERRWIEVPAA